MLIFWLHNPLNQRFLSPFDALKGFNEAIASKDIIYEDRRVLSDEDIRHLNHAIGILYNLTKTRQLAMENHVAVSVTYFAPCKEYHYRWHRSQTV